MSRLTQLFSNKHFRLALIVLIVGATLAAFTYYLVANPKVIGLMFSLHPATLLLIAIGYIGTIIANALVLSASLRIIGKHVPFNENISLTGYSSVVNFFGPLQSGPGFRAAYLKQRHGVSLKKFVSLTVVFYAFFALINGAIIAFAVLANTPSEYALPLTAGGIVVAAIVGYCAYRFIPKVRAALSVVKVSNPNFWLIGFGAFLLSVSTAFAYFFELLHVDPTVGFAQTLVYAAAANLALFVSLTPGAIGFRESFLLLTERLHQIPDNVVIAASIIDRAFYVVFLLALFGLLLAFGVTSRLRSSNARQ